MSFTSVFRPETRLYSRLWEHKQYFIQATKCTPVAPGLLFFLAQSSLGETHFSLRGHIFSWGCTAPKCPPLRRACFSSPTKTLVSANSCGEIFFNDNYQRWSPRGPPWSRGHILKSLALASKPQVLENCPVLGSRTALFFELLKFRWKTPETERKICEHLFCFPRLEHRRRQGGEAGSPPNCNFTNDKNVTKKPIVSSVSVSF